MKKRACALYWLIVITVIPAISTLACDNHWSVIINDHFENSINVKLKIKNTFYKCTTHKYCRKSILHENVSTLKYLNWAITRIISVKYRSILEIFFVSEKISLYVRVVNVLFTLLKFTGRIKYLWVMQWRKSNETYYYYHGYWCIKFKTISYS